MPHNHFSDPDIHYGAFRVLPRTDGGFVIVDERKPVGYRTVCDVKGKPLRWAKAKEAGDVAKAWFDAGHG